MDRAGIRPLVSRYRWWICALLFFATTINYIDRQVISILKPNLTKELGWSEVDYSTIVMWFQGLYAAGYLLAGRFMDIIGVRRGYALSVGLWSLAAMLHGLVSSVAGFSFARALLGISEGGNFPAAVKTVSEWFPQKERAAATGLFNSGSNLGPILAPLTVAWLTLHFGWRSSFIVTGAVGFLWLIWWVLTYKRPREHPSVSEAELQLIESDPPDPVERVPWLRLTQFRATWAFVTGMVFTAPFWWFYLFWAPDFFNKRFGLDLKTVGLPLVTIYIMADIGSIGAGYLSSYLIKRGWTVGKARKSALLLCAICVIPVYFAAVVGNPWAAVGLIGLAAAAHQGFSCNLYTLVSDTMPRSAVSSVVGMGGFFGSLAGMFFSLYVGKVLQATQNFQPMFYMAPIAYLSAILIIHLLVPKFEQVNLDPNP